MKLALAVSPLALSAPASSIRNSDQGPIRSSTAGGPVSLLTEMAVRAEGPGHCTVVGGTALAGGGDCCVPKASAVVPVAVGLAITVPPISVLISMPAAGARGGLIASDTCGTVPPVWEKAARIEAG